MRALRTILVFASGFVFVGSVAFAQSQSSTGDAVADAARKAREAKKDAPKPKKVFTDDDVAPARPAVDPAAAASTTANPDGTITASKSATDDGTNKPEGKSEAAWRKEFAEQHRKISDAQLALDVLQREAQKADVQYYTDPQKAMNEQYNRKEINDKNDKIAAKKKELADLQQQLSDMEDQLKRSGGDPGWAR